MKSLTLFTKTKITADKISQKLINRFSNKTVVQNDEIEIWLGDFPNNFYIIFSDSESIDSETFLMEDWEKELIPFDNAVTNDLYYHKEKLVEEVVRVIAEEYPELIINDEENDYYTAEEYLNGKHAKINSNGKLN